MVGRNMRYLSLRLRVIEMLHCEPNISAREIGRRTGIKSNTAALWVKAYKENGEQGLLNLLNSGEKHLSLNEKLTLKEKLKKPPSYYGIGGKHWITSTVRYFIALECGVLFKSDSGIRYLLESLEMPLPDSRFDTDEVLDQKFAILLHFIVNQPAHLYGCKNNKWRLKDVMRVAEMFFDLKYSDSHIKKKLSALGWSFHKQCVVTKAAE